MEPDKKKKRKSAMEIRLKREIEADRRVKELELVLAAQVKKEAERQEKEAAAEKKNPEEILSVRRDPEEILEEEKFKPSKLTPLEKYREWDGQKSLISVCCAGIAFVLLCVCFGLTIKTKGSVSFGNSVLGLCAVLVCLYGIGFGAGALKKREKQKGLGRAGLVLSSLFFVVFVGIYILGAL